MTSYPLSYTVEQTAMTRTKVALSFDDGPDPVWTPKILDILKQYHVIGSLLHDRRGGPEQHRRDAAGYREGHEIGNHTFTHPDISEISNAHVDLELNLTERLFAAELGVQPLYFRPPYSIDQEPDTNDQAAPAVPHPADSATSSSATRSTPTTGTSTRARARRRSSTASSSRWTI